MSRALQMKTSERDDDDVADTRRRPSISAEPPLAML